MYNISISFSFLSIKIKKNQRKKIIGQSGAFYVDVKMLKHWSFTENK